MQHPSISRLFNGHHSVELTAGIAPSHLLLEATSSVKPASRVLCAPPVAVPPCAGCAPVHALVLEQQRTQIIPATRARGFVPVCKAMCLLVISARADVHGLCTARGVQDPHTLRHRNKM